MVMKKIMRKHFDSAIAVVVVVEAIFTVVATVEATTQLAVTAVVVVSRK